MNKRSRSRFIESREVELSFVHFVERTCSLELPQSKWSAIFVEEHSHEQNI